jgi:hypothetical protein
MGCVFDDLEYIMIFCTDRSIFLSSPANNVSGYIFPALVAALVPVRSYFVRYLFSEEDLKYLDPFAETLTNLPGVKKNKTNEGEALMASAPEADPEEGVIVNEPSDKKTLDHMASTADISVTEHAHANSSEEDA